jgi:hypothetical protein
MSDTDDKLMIACAAYVVMNSVVTIKTYIYKMTCDLLQLYLLLAWVGIWCAKKLGALYANHVDV